ncbi:MAG: hypothetical protein LBS94_04225 [Prevotellaceae bacterium]|jgi:hypothetical protein|nr:hypothetical protein [Prevotellaceae bacterium]
MIIKIECSNDYLPDILLKNPQLYGGLHAMPMRHGQLVGNAVSRHRYDIVFFDGKRSSFVPEEHFSMDFQSYSGPLALLHVCEVMFPHVLQSRNELDVVHCTVEVASFYVDSTWFCEGRFVLEKYFDGLHLERQSSCVFRLTVSAPSVFEAINLLCIVAIFAHCTNVLTPYFSVDESAMQRYVQLLSNLPNVPHFVLHHFNMRALKSETQREEAKPVKVKKRIDRICENKVNAFSPTISPAPKSLPRNEIESIDEALRYFHACGVPEVVVQRKYMGSYCDIYLCKNLEETYFVSRNGYKIDLIDLNAARQCCRALHERFDWSRLALVIVQSELMPWRTLGKTLVENEFLGYLCAHQNHYDYLKSSDLYAKIADVKQSESYLAYLADKAALPAKMVNEKYPAGLRLQYDSLTSMRLPDLETYSASLQIFEEQIRHFGCDCEMHFQPFNILKKVFDDGSEQIANDNLSSYRELNDDEFLQLDIRTEAALELAIERCYGWFDQLSQRLEEGVVIKPRQAFMPQVPPALKVRNNRYLTMICGLDFPADYTLHLNKRSIRSKLECSINDWQLCHEMLQVKYHDIGPDNDYFKKLVRDRIAGEQVEARLDARL